MTVGDRIRERRKYLHLTQEELGKKLGWGRSAVCRVEKEGNNITTDRIAKIAKALHCTPAFLMGWSENANQTSIFDFVDIDSFPCDEHGYPEVRDIDNSPSLPKEPYYEVTADEYALIEKYRRLSKEWKAVVDSSIENGYSHFVETIQKDDSNLPPFSPPWNII